MDKIWIGVGQWGVTLFAPFGEESSIVLGMNDWPTRGGRGLPFAVALPISLHAEWRIKAAEVGKSQAAEAGLAAFGG